MIKLNYPVNINPANNGIIVNVGCKTLVFEESNIDVFLKDLKTLILEGSDVLYEKYIGKLPDEAPEFPPTEATTAISRNDTTVQGNAAFGTAGVAVGRTRAS